ncbi:hypothetical protein HU200_048381 [Digitaria exilis]|uniref:HMA domain-containing protein n=1 Tax=Digitaria exilis TaxID=1010633 RepID=A0A835B1L2_9POAL|nr:hypothetical protein HU200_048381 [Digitaria exilis]
MTRRHRPPPFELKSRRASTTSPPPLSSSPITTAAACVPWQPPPFSPHTSPGLKLASRSSPWLPRPPTPSCTRGLRRRRAVGRRSPYGVSGQFSAAAAAARRQSPTPITASSSPRAARPMALPPAPRPTRPHPPRARSTRRQRRRRRERASAPAPRLLDVSGMMCGGCAARVRGILAADARVETAAVNLLAESAAVRLRAPAPPGAGEELAARLTECGFPSTARRGGAAAGAGESARKWREMAARKEELLARSRGRVAFAWTLVALCCGSHASHILHSLGIHVGHGELSWKTTTDQSNLACPVTHSILPSSHDSNVPPDILFDGFRAFKQGSPNMNSLVGFGSASCICYQCTCRSCFSDLVLLGRSLEESARLKASSDMNELISLLSPQSRLIVTSSSDDPSSDTILNSDAITVEVPVDDVRVGDSILVLPGETIPVDHYLTNPLKHLNILSCRVMSSEDQVFVDESMLTGESLPVAKETGLPVFAGTVNWDGPLKIRATCTGPSSTIAKIVRMVGKHTLCY